MSFFTLPLEGSLGAYLAALWLLLGGGILVWRHRRSIARALGPLADLPGPVLLVPALLAILLFTFLALQEETTGQLVFLVSLFQIGLRFLWGRFTALGVRPVLGWVPYRPLSWPPWFPGGWVVILCALAWFSPAVLVLLFAWLGIGKWRWLRSGTARGGLAIPLGFLLVLSFLCPTMTSLEVTLGNVSGALGVVQGALATGTRNDLRRGVVSPS